MHRKIRVGAVSYLNTIPLIYGLKNGSLSNEIELITDYPANIAAMLQKDEIDIGLVPIAIMPTLQESHIISDYCIGASGPVASVCIFSEVPIGEVQDLMLDYQSKTSVALTKILLQKHWNASPKLVDATEGYEANIGNKKAALIIGDRALVHLHKHAYRYDLAQAWIEMTGLPFVFAAWVANKKLPDKFIAPFSKASGDGLQHLNEIIAETPSGSYDLYAYFTNNIDYYLDIEKMKGMKLFLEML